MVARVGRDHAQWGQASADRVVEGQQASLSTAVRTVEGGKVRDQERDRAEAGQRLHERQEPHAFAVRGTERGGEERRPGVVGEAHPVALAAYALRQAPVHGRPAHGEADEPQQQESEQRQRRIDVEHEVPATGGSRAAAILVQPQVVAYHSRVGRQRAVRARVTINVAIESARMRTTRAAPPASARARRRSVIPRSVWIAVRRSLA